MLKTRRLEKQIKKLEAELTLAKIQHNDDLTTLNNHWGEKFDMVVGMFQAQIEQAGTKNEILKWFKDWTTDVNGIDASDQNAEQEMDRIIEKHGFEFKVKPVPVTHQEILKGYRRR